MIDWKYLNFDRDDSRLCELTYGHHSTFFSFLIFSWRGKYLKILLYFKFNYVQNFTLL
jgi:hypothetical protein